ncbi:hypothetical protein JNL27_16530 [bacterium]|nr:hypothetical protein [bacterium]
MKKYMITRGTGEEFFAGMGEWTDNPSVGLMLNEKEAKRIVLDMWGDPTICIVEKITFQEREQSEAADKQAHADHIRETMEDR